MGNRPRSSGGWNVCCVVCNAEFVAVAKQQDVCSHECRFEKYRDSGDGCHEWKGPRNTCGYGVLFLNQNKENGRRMVVSAHRYAYQTLVGDIPDGMCVMHKCDNRACVNPAHLQLGSHADNNRDRSQKGRSGARVYSDEQRQAYSLMNRGERNNIAKLTEEQAKEIKYSRELGCQRAAKKYGVSPATIKDIRAGRAWRHV